MKLIHTRDGTHYRRWVNLIPSLLFPGAAQFLSGRRATGITLFVLYLVLVAGLTRLSVQAGPDSTFMILSPDDSSAKRLARSEVTIEQDGSNVVVSARIRRWPNLYAIQKEQWFTNATHVVGFLLAYRGQGKGIAQDDRVSWQIINTTTQNVCDLVVLQFPDIDVRLDYLRFHGSDNHPAGRAPADPKWAIQQLEIAWSTNGAQRVLIAKQVEGAITEPTFRSDMSFPYFTVALAEASVILHSPREALKILDDYGSMIATTAQYVEEVDEGGFPLGEYAGLVRELAEAKLEMASQSQSSVAVARLRRRLVKLKDSGGPLSRRAQCFLQEVANTLQTGPKEDTANQAAQGAAPKVTPPLAADVGREMR